MTDLIALAKQAGMAFHMGQPHPEVLKQLQAFADLIRQQEREECAVVAETQWFKSDMRLWEAIRARGTGGGLSPIGAKA